MDHLSLIYGQLDATPSRPAKQEDQKPGLQIIEERKSSAVPASWLATPQQAAEGRTHQQQQRLDSIHQKQKAKTQRKAAGQTWVDPTLEEWPENDYRIFCGDLGNEVTDDGLANAFKKYPSFAKAKVVRDKRTLKSKGFGFVSLISQDDYIKAMREMQGKYVGNRPITLKKSDWVDKSRNSKAIKRPTK